MLSSRLNATSIAIMLATSERKSSRPLTVILAMEFLSRQLRRSPSTTSMLERTEYARRDRDMLWYLLRGAIWDGFTKPKVAALAERTSRLPLLGLAGLLIQDWMPLIEQYHYCESALLTKVDGVLSLRDRRYCPIMLDLLHLTLVAGDVFSGTYAIDRIGAFSAVGYIAPMPCVVTGSALFPPMSSAGAPPPPTDIRRIVAGHDAAGRAAILSDAPLAAHDRHGKSTERSASVWVTTETPSLDNNRRCAPSQTRSQRG
jgi:hypothetical protein